MPWAVFWVAVNGEDITPILEPLLISIMITDGEGGKNDSLELQLDDQDGAIEFPPTNAPIQAGIAYEGDDGALVGPPVQFEGKVDKPGSTFGRGQGLLMTISAKSADVKGKPKEHQEKHHDKGKLSEVAKKWGSDAGLEVDVADGIDIEREYWAMQGESFLNWGSRIAREVGGTFKVRGNRAIIAERSGGQSAGGQGLPDIQAIYGQNIISGTMSPVDDRQTWAKFRTRRYDQKAGKYVYEDVDVQDRNDGGSAMHLNRFNHSDAASAKARGKSNAKEAEREQGGGTITIDGEPSAQAECNCEVIGVREGIDGTYRVASVKHSLSRQGGYQTELTLKQPQGAAGTDKRSAGSSSSKGAGKAGSK